MMTQILNLSLEIDNLTGPVFSTALISFLSSENTQISAGVEFNDFRIAFGPNDRRT